MGKSLSAPVVGSDSLVLLGMFAKASVMYVLCPIICPIIELKF